MVKLKVLPLAGCVNSLHGWVALSSTSQKSLWDRRLPKTGVCASRPDTVSRIFPVDEICSLRFLPLRKSRFTRILRGMDVHLKNPDLQVELDRWVTETGRAPDELVEDAMAGYFDELARTREMLNRRYDDLKSGRVKPISRDQIVAYFREKSATRRTPPG
jgi:hypothetical protein